jgi:maltose alpha-D-glucosyltransferase/alpha-amylase
MDPVYGYQAVNVEAQKRFDTSLLHWMRQFIHQRKKHKMFGRGTFRIIDPDNRSIFAFVREYDGEIALCVFNLSQFPQPTVLDLGRFIGYTPVEMTGNTMFPSIKEPSYQLAVAPLGFYWFLLSPESAT